MTKYLLLAALVLVGTQQVSASIVVDQNQPNSPDYMAAFSQTDLAQSFQQSSSNITGAGIFLQPFVGVTDDITISLYDSLNGTLLASGTTFASSGTWADVDFGSPIAVTPDTTYYLVFTSANDTLGIAGDIGNPYSRGQVYANPGFGSFPTFDYTFRTFAETDLAAVPEPASLAIWGGIGIAGLIAARRRQKAMVAKAKV